MSDSKSLVILPTYNEVSTLLAIVQRVQNSCDAAILIIDDNSPDKTGELADRLARELKNVYVLHRKEKLGLGTAYIAGFSWGIENGFDNLIEMDSDGSHPVEMLREMISLLEKHDLVIGSRYVPGGSVDNWGLSRRLLSRYANLYSRLLLGGKISDMTSGFRGMRSEKIADYLESEPNGKGFAFQIEMSSFAQANSWKVIEFPIKFIERLDGQSKMTMSIKIEAFKFVTFSGFKRKFKF